jgi:hypothetical protein
VIKTAWRTMPITARLGVALWAVAWLFFLIDIYRLTQGDLGSVGKFAAAVSLLFIFLLRGQNWARMIALMANAMSILFLSFMIYIYLMKADSIAMALTVFAIALFGTSIYFLCLRESSGFFKAMSNVEAASKPNESPDR